MVQRRHMPPARSCGLVLGRARSEVDNGAGPAVEHWWSLQARAVWIALPGYGTQAREQRRTRAL